ncbi:putative basic-leucine zipper domain-containing protein [Septoria linicola]|nr:putative basic-leucine zipper domain-containing protein [Septoria linicola]
MSTAESGSVTSMEDDWSHVSDPNERRKIQNRIAQRKFREKVRQQREDTERQYENEQRAAAASNAPEAEDVEDAQEAGLPWGGISMRHIIRTGKEKEKTSRDTSLYAAGSKAGGSSRLGLHLCEEYARGCPAWTAWRTKTSAPPPPAALMLGSNVQYR